MTSYSSKPQGKTDYTQTTIEGFVSGDLIKAPAGDIAAAVGVFYQRDEINDVPDDHVLAGNVWGSSSAGITAGAQSSKAIYGELSVPLAKGATFFESLNCDSFRSIHRNRDCDDIR